jgi:multiple sugar transport system ATP-binding protein
MAHVELHAVSKSYDGTSFAVRDLDLDCPEGEMLALLGPSGCGKSSTLKMIAGIEPVTSGAIRFDGVDVTERDCAGRNVAMVFEDYALYPHLTVFDNIAFPLRLRRVAAAEVERRVRGIVEMLGLGALAAAPVRSLSGGAQQRVSIGRALARDPALVMFDEPLSHLDADQKVVLRTEIRRLQSTAGLTSVLVTHDQTEAMAMADRSAVMDHGVLQQVGTPRQLYDAPANRFVAGFIGETPMNFFDAVFAEGGAIRLAGLGSAPIALAGVAGTAGAPIVLGVRPEAIVPSPAPAHVAASSLALAAQVLDHECLGDREVLRLRAGATVFHAEMAAAPGLRRREHLECHVPAAHVLAFSAASGEALRQAPC